MIKQAVVELLEQVTDIETSSDLLETPQDRMMGDIALPCFTFAKELKKSPIHIAMDIAGHIQPNTQISRIKATGPYVNFFVNPAWIAGEVLGEIAKKKDMYGSSEKKHETIVIESPSPNTNKPLHLGHVRNMLLGNALQRIHVFYGYSVIRTDIVNDRGTHICKSMLMYDRYGNGEQPTMKTDHFVGKRYVRFSQELKKDPTLDIEAQHMLQQREEGDAHIVSLWTTMRNWALDGFAQTYERFGVDMQAVYYESDIYTHGKQIVQEGLEKGIFTQDETGAIYVDLTEQGYDKKYVQRSDGTAIYITQDLYLGKLRYEQHAMKKMIYIVGSEQEYHFQVLFEIFKLLGYEFADACHHMSYGMISLPDGKMKSREGNVVDADTLAQEMHAECLAVIQERYPDMPNTDAHERAEQIALGAIKFFILLYDPKKDFVFDRDASLRFDGESGPYIQYTHARCASILTKLDIVGEHIEYSLLAAEEERVLLVLLSEFPQIVARAATQYQSYLVARYVLDLSKLFNTRYQKHKVITDDVSLSCARGALVAGVKQVLRNGLYLLGIDAPQKM